MMFLLWALSANAEDIQPIKQNEPAPFDGVVYSHEAAANLLAKLEFQEEKCNSEIEFAQDMILAESELKIDNFEISLKSCRNTLDETIKYKNEQLKYYKEANSKNSLLKNELRFLLGFTLGSATSVGIAYGYWHLTNTNFGN